MATGPMDQQHRYSRVSGHPAVAPRGHRGDRRIEVKSFFSKAILESEGALLVRDTVKNSVANKLIQAVRQTMGRQTQILPNRVEPADAKEHISEDQHGPAVADD